MQHLKWTVTSCEVKRKPFSEILTDKRHHSSGICEASWVLLYRQGTNHWQQGHITTCVAN